MKSTAKNIIHISQKFLVLGAWIGLGWLAVSAVQLKKEMPVGEVVVEVFSNRGGIHLLDVAELEEYIGDWLTKEGNSFSISDFPAVKLSRFINDHPYVESASLYVSKNGNLKAEIMPAYPIARVIHPRGNSYLIDDKGNVMPITGKVALKLPVISGRVPNENAMEEDEVKRRMEISQLVTEIEKSEFLSVLVDQIIVTALGEYMIIPRVGNEKINLGVAERMEEKLMDLEDFYTEVIAQIGWNHYEAIDLKYAGQIVGKKKTKETP